MTSIDAHHHFWDRSISDFDYTWQEAEGLENICRDFMPGDLKPLIREAGIDATVLVQTQHLVEENRWALNLADENGFICGVVGWVDLASEDCEKQLEEFVEHPKFVGVRHVVQDEPDDDFIVGADVSGGLATLEKFGVPYDLLFFPRHLKHAVTVARRFPGLSLVIDHLAKPNIRKGELDPWRQEIQAAAACPNVYCKFSGLVTEADWQNWTVDDLRPCVDTMLEAFGPGRIMFGSDWPVCKLAAGYKVVVEAARQLTNSLSDDEKSLIFGGTATQFYQLNTSSAGQILPDAN